MHIIVVRSNNLFVIIKIADRERSMMTSGRTTIGGGINSGNGNSNNSSDLQHFCLRWNNYRNNITTAFDHLRHQEDFIDVTLACDGKSLKAHRVVLSACSPYFKQILKSTPCKHPVIVLQDVSFDDLQALVEFIYHGEVNVKQTNLTSFLKTAEVLKVSGLTQHASSSTTTPTACADVDVFDCCTTSPISSGDCDKQQRSSPSNANNNNQLIESPKIRNQPHQNRKHRDGICSPISIRRCSFPSSREESPIALKRPKSTDSNISACSGGNVDRHRKDDDDDAASCSPISSLNANYDENHNDDHNHRHNELDDEPPVDFSTRTKKFALPLLYPNLRASCSPPKDLSTLKEEPMDLVSISNTNLNQNDDDDDEENSVAADDDDDDEDENNDDVLSLRRSRYGASGDLSDAPLDIQAAHAHAHTNNRHGYLDGKLFAAAAAAGATFNFNMAAALAADSLAAAGFSHANHANSVVGLDGFGSSSQADEDDLLSTTVPPPLIGAMNEPQRCPYCRRTFSCYYSLKRHFHDKHDVRRHVSAYTCEFCQRRYRTKNSLTTHKSLQHRASSGLLKRLIKSSGTSNYCYYYSAGSSFSGPSSRLPHLPLPAYQSSNAISTHSTAFQSTSLSVPRFAV